MRADAVSLPATLGQPVVVSLDVNAATGFLWQPVFNAEEVTLEERHVSPPQATPGAATRESFHFVPLRTGKVRIVFELRRPWEQDAREQRVYLLDVNGSATDRDPSIV